MAKPLNIIVCGSLVPDPLQTLEPVQTPQGPGLKNEQMLPSVLDPWAACALYEAANLAKQRAGSTVTLVALGPKAKLQQLMMTVAQKAPFQLVAVNAPAGGFTDARETAAELAKAIKAIPGLDLSATLLFGGCASASRDAGVTLQFVAETLGITEFFMGVDELKLRLPGGDRLGHGQPARAAEQPADRHDEHARHHARAHEGAGRQRRRWRHRLREDRGAVRQARDGGEEGHGGGRHRQGNCRVDQGLRKYDMKIAAFTIDGNGTFAQDVPAFAAALAAAGADIVLVPGTSRARRSMPAAAMRAGAAIDTNVVDVTVDGDKATVQRWAYRQRILTAFSRAARPWVIVTDPALFADICAKLGVAPSPIPAGAPAETRTKVNGVVAAGTGGESTIRPDSPLLFVAGAGWTKKQADGATHLDEAAATITGFLAKSGASLGSSKSLVDMPEAAKAFSFMSHMNQVGQTGATPRHAKGLSTCCHGEEPHVVGWRFVNDRRAVNLDANCGWAQGKADVLYVADAFAVMKKVNELLA